MFRFRHLHWEAWEPADSVESHFQWERKDARELEDSVKNHCKQYHIQWWTWQRLFDEWTILLYQILSKSTVTNCCQKASLPVRRIGNTEKTPSLVHKPDHSILSCGPNSEYPALGFETPEPGVEFVTDVPVLNAGLKMDWFNLILRDGWGSNRGAWSCLRQRFGSWARARARGETPGTRNSHSLTCLSYVQQLKNRRSPAELIFSEEQCMNFYAFHERKSKMIWLALLHSGSKSNSTCSTLDDNVVLNIKNESVVAKGVFMTSNVRGLAFRRNPTIQIWVTCTFSTVLIVKTENHTSFVQDCMHWSWVNWYSRNDHFTESFVSSEIFKCEVIDGTAGS